jgi:hypothetical protein
MVHAMQAPQRRHGMEQDVLQVDRQVEGENGERIATHAGSARACSRKPQPRASQRRQGDCRGGKSSRTSSVSRDHHAEIARPAHLAAQWLMASRGQTLPDHEEDH